MRPLLLLSLLSLPCLLLPAPAAAQFASFPAADLVLGAPGFNAAGGGAPGASEMNDPSGVAIDPTSGKVFVAVPSQNRVLRFVNAAALTNGANAEAVLGQINFAGTGSATTQTGMNYPFSVSVDQQGRLWVSDTGNHRILRFDGAATLANGAPADRVLGQTNFISGSSDSGSDGLNYPTSVFADTAGNLWVADYINNRVLRYGNAAGLGNGAAASAVLGQATFAILSAGTSQTKMNRPATVYVDPVGRLWVSEQLNNRVLRFDAAAGLANGAAASAVLGQANFTSSSSGLGAASLDNPAGLAMDAAGTLYVGDAANNRVLFFRNVVAKGNGSPADGVFGQVNLTTNAAGVSQRNLDNPYGSYAIDAGGALWVCDGDNNRILRFSPDRTRPTVRVTKRVPATTTSGRLALAGKSADATSGIESVRVRVNKGPSRLAKGTTSWRAKVKLGRGKNLILITATDGAGNLSAPRRLRVTRGG